MAGFPIFTPPSPSPFFNLPRQPDYSGGIAAGIGSIGDSFRANRKEEFDAQNAADLQAYRNAQIEADKERIGVAKLGVGADLAKLGLTFDTTGSGGTSTPGSGVSSTGGPDWGGSGFKPIPGYKKAPDAATVTATNQLRDDYNKQPGTSRYKQASPVFKSMSDNYANPDAMADQDFIYGMGKIMDPTSAVMTGELAMVMAKQSLPGSLFGQLEQAWRGGAALQPETRAQILRALQPRVEAYRKQAEAEAEYYRKVAEEQGVDPNWVVQPLDDSTDISFLPPRPPTTAPVPTASAPPAGSVPVGP